MEHLTPANHIQAEQRAHELNALGQHVVKIVHDGANGYNLLFAADVPAPTAAEIAAEQIASAKQHFIALATAQLNAAAAAHHYTNIDTACAYASAPNPFQAESQLFVAYRGNVWAACYALEAAVLAGTRAMPTDAEFLAALPVAP